jgi:phosphatidylserine/phosphatidylglycerophosphate/cardiolipin synthase-like enzyme
MIYVEPDAGVTPVVNFIEAAQRQILINVYYIDDPDILRAIGTDVSRGVHVYVQIAGNPYRMSNEKLQDEESAIMATGAQLKLAPPQFEGKEGHYSFDHAKFAVSDQGVLIGTANWDVSAFSKNREYIYTATDPSLNAALTAIFVNDYTGKAARDTTATDSALVVSPGSENRILQIIEQTGPVNIEVEELGNDPDVLAALDQKGNELRIIIPKNGASEPVISNLESHGVSVRILNGLYVHGKTIEGQAYDFVGSQNFSTTSLQWNREIGIFTNLPNDMSPLANTFETDWANAN